MPEQAASSRTPRRPCRRTRKASRLGCMRSSSVRRARSAARTRVTARKQGPLASDVVDTTQTQPKNTELSDLARHCAADWTAPFASRLEWGIANSWTIPAPLFRDRAFLCQCPNLRGPISYLS